MRRPLSLFLPLSLSRSLSLSYTLTHIICIEAIVLEPHRGYQGYCLGTPQGGGGQLLQGGEDS